MNDLKDNKIKRGYSLIVSSSDEKKKKVLYESSLIEELDYFTSHFYNFSDMLCHIKDNFSDDYDFAYIQRNGGKFTRYVVLYYGNLFDFDKVIEVYTNYLLRDHDYFNKYSPVKSVNLSEFDYQKYDDYIKYCCLAYFSKKNYRDVRGAYVELKELGLDKEVVVRDSDIDDELGNKQIIYKENDDLDKMMFSEDGPDWDSIYSQFDLDDITTYRNVSTRRRK